MYGDVIHGNVDTVKLLMEAGANVNAVAIYVRVMLCIY